MPTVFLLDENAKPHSWSMGAEQLWHGIQADVLLQIEENPAVLADGGTLRHLHEGRLSIQIARLEGSNGYCVLVEPLRTRDPLRGIGEKFLLTRREMEVARLLTEGARTLEIAERLSISPATVVVHVKRIMAKTQSKTRTAVVGRIVRHGGDAWENAPASE